MTDLKKGLFIHNKLNPHKESKCKRFCRVFGASIYTSILKTRNMLIAYKVCYWDHEPNTLEDFANFKVFRNDNTKNIIIVFEHPRVLLTQDELITACMKHFLEINSFKPSTKVLSEEIDNLYFSRSRKFSKSIIYPGATVTAWDIIHKTRYESIDGLYPELADSYVTYSGNFLENKEYKFNWKFDNNNINFNIEWKEDLSKDVLNHLDTQETIDYCNQHFGE